MIDVDAVSSFLCSAIEVISLSPYLYITSEENAFRSQCTTPCVPQRQVEKRVYYTSARFHSVCDILFRIFHRKKVLFLSVYHLLCYLCRDRRRRSESRLPRERSPWLSLAPSSTNTTILNPVPPSLHAERLVQATPETQFGSMPPPKSLRSLMLNQNVTGVSNGPPSPTLSEATQASQMNFGANGPEKIITRADLKSSLQAHEDVSAPVERELVDTEDGVN